MDTKLMLSTFALIFLAELGDKTQLTTLARAASEDAPWSVFLGASLALIASTVLAVLFGSALSRLVAPQVLKGVAGALFLVFGVLLLSSALRARPDVAPAEAAQPAAAGLVSSLTFQTALAFEEASAAHFREMAEAELDADLREVWRWLADEESRHVQEVRSLIGHAPPPGTPKARDIPVPQLAARVRDEARKKLVEAIEHERSTAAFYDALADATRLQAMGASLRALARDERAHAARLEAAVETA